MIDIKKEDFKFVSQWSVDENGGKWSDIDQPKYLIDGSTGRRYLNESKNCVRFKCVLLTIGTPLAQPIFLIVNTIFRLFKIITFANFWLHRDGENGYDFKGRLKDTGIDAARIVLFPIIIIGLELSSIYGLVSPYNGRKLYASIERACYGNLDRDLEYQYLAPCFQPDPQNHAFGGDINRRNQF